VVSSFYLRLIEFKSGDVRLVKVLSRYIRLSG